MPAIDIPGPLPPAITPDREIIEFFIDEDLAEFGQDGLVARTWQWVLHGGGRGPISRMDWTRFDGDGPPSAATSPPKAPPMNRPSDRLRRGTSSTGPGSSAGYAPPNPETNCRYASTPGTPPRHQPSPKKARSPSAKTPATERLNAQRKPRGEG
jgi:hypothetical protein